MKSGVVDISMILPTRGRVPQLRRALDSIQATARQPEALEVVLYVDDDDLESQALDFTGLQVTKVVGSGGTMSAMTAACYDACQGRCLMLANDDIVFRTPGWDAEVLAAFQRVGDDVAMVWGNDLCSRAPCHPFLSRTVCELAGGICPAGYYREFIDTHWYDIFRTLERRGHSRAVYLPHVIIEHLHVIAGKAELDEGYANRRREHDELVYVERRQQRAQQAARLADYIDRRPSDAGCGVYAQCKN